ncbi:hypothetical protein CF386_09170 [Paraphotobacterium marinum]|uniref:DUF3658 domain-containing protein n=1 Tax=Paraphotobacterium marinum TaxID=1755811 RepID=A0A220VG11_9GAMM|nr:DUF3658 domain-containing protein [Paraphotobacterium marinum]ASK79231.1 hypothetical protein CF386_09170 [Paraphotobacterium marinum]
MNAVEHIDNFIHISTYYPMHQTLLKFFDEDKIVNIDTQFLYTGPNIIPGDKQTYHNFGKWFHSITLSQIEKRDTKKDNEFISYIANKMETLIGHEFLQSMNTKDINILCWVDDQRVADILFKHYLVYFYEINNVYFIDNNYINKYIFQHQGEQVESLFTKPWSYKSIKRVFDNKQKLSKSEYQFLKKSWANILNFNGYIRIYENEVLRNEEENYFDTIILERLKKEAQNQTYRNKHNLKENIPDGYIKLSFLYAIMMSEYQLTDSFVITRLIQLIEQKQIDYMEVNKDNENLSLYHKMLQHYFIKIKP